MATIVGTNSSDKLTGTAGPDDIFGLAGDDFLIGGAGADSLDGGTGTDTASYSTASAGVVANLAAPAGNTGDAAGDSYASIENLRGSNFADALTGDGVNNTVSGLNGTDALAGGGGDDILIGGAGGDSLDGGVGTDTASYSTAATGVVANLSAPAGNTGDAAGDSYTAIENLQGSNFGDTLTGNAVTNTLSGLSGEDALIGGAGADSLDGGAGIDTASYATAGAGLVASLLSPAGNTGDAAGDSYTSIENLTGSDLATR